MNFFKSIISDDQDDPPESEIHRDSDPESHLVSTRDEHNSNEDGDGWSFGGMIKTIAMQSESVIEIYRRDIQEFGLGLRKETEIFRETASRAVKDLPASLEAAHGALDGVLKTTANIISKESLGFSSDGDSGTPGTNRSSNSGRYSRFEAQLSAIQNDLNTYCVQPEGVEDYGKWKLGFELESYREDIDSLIGGNGVLEGVYKRVVPSSVDGETFWCRYFYRVDKLKQQESVRAKLVRRAISLDDDELFSWDVDDDDEEDTDQNEKGGDHDGNSKLQDEDEKNVASEMNNVEEEEKPKAVGEVRMEEKVKSDQESDTNKSDEKGEPSGQSDSKIESSLPSEEVAEEELRWDEIEDTGSGGAAASPKKDVLRK